MATDQLIARDAVIRQAAFDHIRGLQSRDVILDHEEIARGFIFEGERWPLVNLQRGIFKPRRCSSCSASAPCSRERAGA